MTQGYKAVLGGSRNDLCLDLGAWLCVCAHYDVHHVLSVPCVMLHFNESVLTLLFFQ
jgi:hypothetical protein